jgi:hypothetical protein
VLVCLVGLLLWVTVAVGAATAAEAQPAPGARVLVLVTGGDAGLARRLGATTREEAAAALGRRGFSASQGPAGCADTECATELLSRGDASHAVAIALWGRGARCERVAVTLVDGVGSAYGGEVAVEGADVARALDAALEAALARAARGAGVRVRVSGSPEGATITLDRIPWGTLPHEAPVAEGEHTLAVSAEGYESERRALTVGEDPVHLEVRLAPTADGRPTATREDPVVAVQSGAPDPLLLGLGTAVGVVGLASGSVGVLALAAPAGPSSDPGSREEPDVGAAAAWLGVGAAALLGGVVLLIVGATSAGPAGPRAARTGSGSPFVISF